MRTVFYVLTVFGSAVLWSSHYPTILSGVVLRHIPMEESPYGSAENDCFPCTMSVSAPWLDNGGYVLVRAFVFLGPTERVTDACLRMYAVGQTIVYDGSSTATLDSSAVRIRLFLGHAILRAIFIAGCIYFFMCTRDTCAARRALRRTACRTLPTPEPTTMPTTTSSYFFPFQTKVE